MKQTHAILDGAVFCVDTQHPVELEECFACPHLVTLDLDSARPRVVCEIPEERDAT